ncbi:hypothetical protein AD45P2_00335 [Alteromonas phage vB_AmaP_AD45-P2]|uniref:Uncharacterized protein n=1 Tax=Pseudorhizobium pelagicum TaxID=1509405 RepID=A0A922P0K1_9HYPH|nr:hypothetical protein [Pseudorhizobium pelagicum]YP_008126038.1 hypothetical protein M610_gp114 [Alteromonas phage vB_AmaP_AD45-P1]AGM46885.1 hypothetical protein AD45P1_00335 [Alteromonas phage vB_AmaP_AD45-P1]AGM47238.1 hypothetical protein AD45P2_00335 [Alteromonas phage vB_AmaP_AD45-P2]KEQ05641.1 hypothetical protein GV68_08920 [Pseudorhizobium pelagicum]
MASLYVIVFKGEDDNTIFLMDKNEVVMGSDHGALVQRMAATVSHLEWCIKGSPVRYRHFFGERVSTTPISDKTKKLYQRMIDTMRIEPVYNMILGSPKTHLIDMKKDQKEKQHE